MSAGRPPFFETEQQLQSKVEEYFESIKPKSKDESGEPATVTGLALFLGFESRQSFYDYEEKDKFSYTIKRARLRVENQYEKRLSDNAPTGAIFALKNLGWKDQIESKNTNTNYNSEPLTPEKIKEINKALENDY